MDNAPSCSQCGHAAHLHVPGTDQCNYRLDDEWRCCCDGYEVSS